MTPDEARASLNRFLAEIGEDIVIRRFTGAGTPRPKIERTVRARVVGYQPNQMVGPIVQGDRKVIASVEALGDLLPLLTTDKAVVRGKELAIKAVDDSTRRIAGVLIGLELQVSG